MSSRKELLHHIFEKNLRELLIGVSWMLDQERLSFCPKQRCVTGVPIRELVAPLSYSDSFMDELLVAASEKGIKRATWVMAQYDFAYTPRNVKRPVDPTAIFLGAFRFSRG